MMDNELYDVIIEYVNSGMTPKQIASVLGCDTKMVNRARSVRMYNMNTFEDRFIKEWDSTRKPIRKAIRRSRRNAEKAKEREEKNAVIYHRADSRNGYWWQRRNDYYSFACGK